MIILYNIVTIALLLKCTDSVYTHTTNTHSGPMRVDGSEEPFISNSSTTYLYNDYNDENKKNELEFEPVMTLNTNEKEKRTIFKNVNCDDFSQFALNCTMEAAMIYNSSRKTPPMPDKIHRWCKAIRFLTNCAIDWNTDCKDVTDSHFNEESIRGHMHVVSNVCDDEWFLRKYGILPRCIEGAQDFWETCYTSFKNLVDEQKNTTHEWTHFATHFYMCCARARFRRCTLDALFDMPGFCTYEEAVTLQKFSVIVSKGDVFQDCEHNMMYSNCPGGDPRPSGQSLRKLKNVITSKPLVTLSDANNRAHSLQSNIFLLNLFWIAYFIFMCGFVK